MKKQLKQTAREHPYWVLFVLSLIVTGIVLALKNKVFRKQSDIDPDFTDTDGLGDDENSILEKGDKGDMVRKLQTALNDYQRKMIAAGDPSLIPFLAVDGVFGAKTEAFLYKYTQQKTISVTELETLLKQKLADPKESA